MNFHTLFFENAILPSTLSNNWRKEETSTWSLLNFDMYIVDKISDITKDKAHTLFISKTEELVEIHSRSHELVARIESLYKEFKGFKTDEAGTYRWFSIVVSDIGFSKNIVILSEQMIYLNLSGTVVVSKKEKLLRLPLLPYDNPTSFLVHCENPTDHLPFCMTS
ncbi:hypothetical protein BDC45DRAFT_530278 [Circinella umbellata]|nr:hypothetical protein BDC45DRAFT_530278 [Circinella umbellata]